MRVVIPSVNYADYLAATLPAWCQILNAEHIRIVTTDSDYDSKRVADENGCQIIVTDRWKQDGAILNKAAAMDEAFGFTGSLKPPDHDELCFSIDADTHPFGNLPQDSFFESDFIYGCHRYMCESPNKLHKVINGELKRHQMSRMISWGKRARQSHHRHNPQVLCGYVQAFRYKAGMSFGSYPAANEYDVQFALKFPYSKLIPSLWVMHLGENHVNWTGRVSEKW